MNSNISVATEIEVYDLPEQAVIGSSWELPTSYIDTYDSINAPYWDIEEPQYMGYIRSVKKTDDPDQVEVEYYIYRQNNAHCSGYYGLWTTGKALVDINTHRRWDVD